MKCLYCGKDLNRVEENTGWHKRCIRKFFGMDVLPVLEVSDQELEKLAESSVNKSLTVTGVQKKLSLHLSLGKEKRLTIVDKPAGYILKPQSSEYSFLPECEQMAMKMADDAGIKTVQHALMVLHEGEYAYITKRADRLIQKNRNDPETVSMYAMEDFCQLSGRLTADKYSSSYERCAAVIQKYSDQPGIDLTEFFMRIVFSFIIGNSDMHLKNFSLIEREPASRVYILSPAYDMLAVNLVLPEDQEEMALTLNGKKRNLHRKDFMILADHCRINAKAASSMMDELLGKKNVLMKDADDSFLPEQMKQGMKKIIEERCARLCKQVSG